MNNILYIQQIQLFDFFKFLDINFGFSGSFSFNKPILLSKYLAQSLVNSTFPSPTNMLGFWLITIPVPVAIVTAVLTIPPRHLVSSKYSLTCLSSSSPGVSGLPLFFSFNSYTVRSHLDSNGFFVTPKDTSSSTFLRWFPSAQDLGTWF